MLNTNNELGDGKSNTSLIPPKPSGSDDGYVYPITAFPPASAFETSEEFPALILPAKRTHPIRKQLKTILYSRPRLSIVVEIGDPDLDTVDAGEKTSNRLVLTEDNRRQYRKLVLDPEKAGLSGSKEANSDTMHELLKSLMHDEPDCFRLGKHTITLSYDDFTADEILKRLLKPEGIAEIPGAFEAVGHLAHLNLRHEVLPYKYLIGKVLLDKNNPRIQTVVHKLSSIDTKFRTFGMEVIAGKGMDGDNSPKDETNSWSNVLVKEEGCEYRLDFRKVYWNSRLGGEHRRLVQLIRNDATNQSSPIIVADLMAGIGPFAVPLTARNQNMANANSKKKKKNQKNNDDTTFPITVHANDLNPSSYEYLVINAERNKCNFIERTNENSYMEDDENYRLHVYNMDGRAFCHELQDRGIFPDHCIMNLPATALEFLDAFRGYPCKDGSADLLPRIHVHCFAPKDTQEAKSEIWKRAESALGCSLDETADQASVHVVRDVSPNKNMYCLSFRLPIDACALARVQLVEDEQEGKVNDDTDGGTQGNSKRPKLDQ